MKNESALVSVIIVGSTKKPTTQILHIHDVSWFMVKIVFDNLKSWLQECFENKELNSNSYAIINWFLNKDNFVSEVWKPN